MATDGSLLGKAGKWRACGWAVGQLDYDAEMVPLLGMYDSVEAEFDVQRTIKSACKRVIGGRCRIMDQNFGRITWSGREGHLWCKWNMLRRIAQRRKRKICRIFRISSPKTMRKLMSWQKKKHCWMKSLWRKQERKTMQHEREEVYAALHTRQRMEPKLINCCKPEPMCTQGCGKMLKRIHILEDGRVLGKEARSWRIEGQKRKKYQSLPNKFEMEGFIAQNGLWNLVGEKVLRESGKLPEEEGDVIGEYKAMHEEIFLSSWLREIWERERRTVEMSNENEEETSEKRSREEEKEETGEC